MTDQIDVSNGNPPLDRFHEIEIEKISEGMQSFQGMRVQFFTFFGTIDLAVVSIAFSAQKAGMLFLAGIIMWISVFVDMVLVSILARYYYRAFVLEERYAPADTDTFLSIFFMDRLGVKIKKIANLPQEKRAKELNRLPVKHLMISGFWVPVCIGLAEMGLGLLLVFQFNWSYF
jgi:hypothetical protein